MVLKAELELVIVTRYMFINSFSYFLGMHAVVLAIYLR